MTYNNSHFQHLSRDVDVQEECLIVNTKVRWLCRGKCYAVCLNLTKIFKIFLKEDTILSANTLKRKCGVLSGNIGQKYIIYLHRVCICKKRRNEELLTYITGCYFSKTKFIRKRGTNKQNHEMFSFTPKTRMK